MQRGFKAWTVGVSLLSVVMAALSGAAAEDATEPAGQARTPAAVEQPAGRADGPAAAPASIAPQDDRERAVREWRDKLDGSTWSITLTPVGEAGKKPRQDQLRFTDVQVTSDVMTKEGYGSSNYSLRLDGDQATWETMQSKEGATAFLRGDISDGSMQGALKTRQGESAQEWNFSGSRTGTKAEAAPAAPAPVEPSNAADILPPEAASPAVQSTEPSAAAAVAAPEEPKKKRRRW